MTVSRPDLGPFFSRVGSRVDVPLPSGRYTATIRVGTAIEPVAYARDIVIVPGSATERPMTLPVGRLVINLTRAGLPAAAFVDVAPVETPDLISMAGWAEGSIEAVLPQGAYRVRVSRYAGDKVYYELDEVTVVPGERITLHLDLGEGTVRVAPTATDGAPLTGTVQVVVGGTEHVVAEGNVDVPISVPAGEYDIRVETEAGDVLWAWGISVRAGEEREVVMERPQARLWARALDPGDRILPAWGTLFTGEGATVREGRLPARWIVPPGEYTLEVSSYDALESVKESAPFSLDAGDAYTVVVPVEVARLTIAPANADRVGVAIFSAEDTETVLAEGEGGMPSLRLPPGTYTIRVWDTSHPQREVWLEDIVLTSGEAREIRVHFE